MKIYILVCETEIDKILYFQSIVIESCLTKQAGSCFKISSNSVQSYSFLGYTAGPDVGEEVSNKPYYWVFIISCFYVKI